MFYYVERGCRIITTCTVRFQQIAVFCSSQFNIFWASMSPACPVAGHGHRRRNRGGKGALAPRLSRGGGQKEVSAPPPFWARTYLKIPPRSLFFHPHNSAVLTPNQYVRRCFDKFIGVGTRGEGARDPDTPPQCFSSVCGGGLARHAKSPFGPVFQCPAI